MRRRSSAGFSLLEVLVASAIAIASMAVIIQLFGAGLFQMDRVSASAQEILVQKEVANRLATLNPALANEGEGMVGPWQYHWSVRQIQEFKPVSPHFGEALVPRVVGLFEISVEAESRKGKRLDWQMTRVGWRDE